MSPNQSVLILLLRNDLRLHDNPLFQLKNAPKGVSHILPVYVFDDRIVDLSGVPGWQGDKEAARSRILKIGRCGANRTKFLAEAVYDVKDRLVKQLSSDLLVTLGRAEVVVPKIAEHLKKQGVDIVGVWVNSEVTTEEVSLERRLASALRAHSVNLTRINDGFKTLVHPQDAPFPPTQTPDVFTHFRKAVEDLGDKMIRPCLPTPTSLPPTLKLDKVEGVVLAPADTVDVLLPHLLKPYGGGAAEFHEDSAHPYKGGETAGLERVEHYCAKGGSKAPLSTYKQTRNGMIGQDYSTKLSAWLGLGCVSPRRVAQAVKDWEETHTGGKGTKDSYWLIFELLWRDYFTYLGPKYGSAFFREEGFNGVSRPGANKGIKWKYCGKGEDGEKPLQRWRDGRTGVAFIDANMLELKMTGFMSNRGRQNVACYLTKDLEVDWRAGAEVFEEELVDYDTSSNFGNWQYVSGVGTDPREARYFNPIKQGKDYDPKAEYINLWIPSLKNVPAEHAHHPWTLPSDHPARKDVDQLYLTPPKEERSAWRGQYERKAGGKGGEHVGKVRGKGPGGGRGRGGGGGGGGGGRGSRGRGGRGGRGSRRGHGHHDGGEHAQQKPH